MAFTHLHVHTEFSLLDGSNKIEDYIERIKELGMTSAAITDHGNMYGAIDFYEKAREIGLHPIIGCEVYVAPGSRFDKEITGGENRYHHLVLLAENNKGYSNLVKIVSKGYTEGYYYRPRVDFEVLQQYHEGIIALSACLAGELPRYIQRGDLQGARRCAKKYEDCFGKGNYFLELQDHGIPEQRTVNTELLLISKELDIPLVATNDVHYTYAEDAEAHDVLLCIQTGKKVADKDRMRYEGGQYYVKSEQEMKDLFPYALQAIENTEKIAQRCNVTITFGETKLPHYEVPEGFTSWTYLNKQCLEGLQARYPQNWEPLKERLDYELDVIKNMGFVDYFLIVWDFINYAKEHDIMVGPGRGSAAGSLVAYSLRITDIDPIKYNLLFERFLNPDRVSMPDIDIDFCVLRRQEVINYVTKKYGAEKVVQIVTFGRMLAKGVIRDVGRVLDMPYALCDRLAKMIPAEQDIKIKNALEINPELKKLYDENAEVQNLIDMSIRLEGLPRQTGMHAAGVLICPEAADNFVPLSCGADGSITTQYTMTTLEHLGLLKMDFLGLRNLTVIQHALRNIEKTKGQSLNLQELDYNDPQVLASLGTGKTEGIFQLESAGMKDFMKTLKPESLEDVIAGISLYRPGPMDFIPKYIAGKNHPEEITYECPQLEPILAPTYGCIVYQEQVMQIVRDLAGYTMGRSDNVRRAMSKKKFEVMQKERDIFIHGNADEIRQAKKRMLELGADIIEVDLPPAIPGCEANGIAADVANHIYDTMMDFAKYAFNKSHAACYAVVAYQTAFLKFYYPVEYMAALMSSVIDQTSKVSYYIQSCRSMGIHILPPDINKGEADFSVAEGGIVYGLTAIRGVGRNIIEEIVAERERRGPYRDLKDFIERIGDQAVNKRAMENFIKAGVFDGMGATRKELMYLYAPLMDSIHKERKSSLSGQMTLFDLMEEEEKDNFSVQIPAGIGEYPKEMLLAYEKEVLGIYVSGHPLDQYAGLWKKQVSTLSSSYLYEEDQEFVLKDEQKASIGGILVEKTVKYTKRGDQMAFLLIEDLVGTVEVIVFPKVYQRYSGLLVEEQKIKIQGKVSLEENKNAKLIAEEIVPFDQIPKTLWIQLEQEENYEKRYEEVLQCIAQSDGTDRIGIFFKDTKNHCILPPNRWGNAEELQKQLGAMLDEENVRVTF